MPNILITGYTGSMGHYLSDFLRVNVKDAVVFGWSRGGLPGQNTFHFDMARSENMAFSWMLDLIEEAKPDMIFHLAAMANVRESFDTPTAFMRNNVMGTQNLFEAIRQTGIKPRIVLASTSEVYGNPLCTVLHMRLDEENWFDPVNHYAVTKCCQELIATTYRHTCGLDVVITRAFGYINPLRADLVATSIANQIVQFERGEINEVRHGNLDPIRSFCDARDIAKAYWLAATKGASGEAYNIGSEQPCSIGDLIRGLAKHSRKQPVKLLQDPTRMRPTDIMYCVPDCTKFRGATGWSPYLGLDESLHWLMEYVRK